MSRFGWRQLLLIVPIIGIVIILNNRQIEQLPTPSQPSADNRESDYYLRQVHITRMGSDGAIEDEIFSERLIHYPHDDHSDLSSPRFKIHRKNGEYLWARSREGVIYGEERVVLSQEVNIEQHSSDNQTTSRIKSKEIEIERATSKVTSRERVTITGENYTIVAGAMELLANEKRLYLSKGVEGHYEP